MLQLQTFTKTVNLFQTLAIKFFSYGLGLSKHFVQFKEKN